MGKLNWKELDTYTYERELTCTCRIKPGTLAFIVRITEDGDIYGICPLCDQQEVLRWINCS